jgi:hypothetical protein
VASNPSPDAGLHELLRALEAEGGRVRAAVASLLAGVAP